MVEQSIQKRAAAASLTATTIKGRPYGIFEGDPVKRQNGNFAVCNLVVS